MRVASAWELSLFPAIHRCFTKKPALQRYPFEGYGLPVARGKSHFVHSVLPFGYDWRLAP